MRFYQTIKSCLSSFFAIAAASFLLVSLAHAECTFFTGWVDNKDGTVRDPRNGLIWKRCAEGFKFANGVCTGVGAKANWEDAKLMAKKSRFLKKNDWRLPAKEEFENVIGTYDDCNDIDYENGEYAASKMIAHNGNWFWSSTPHANRNNLAWFVYFDLGGVDEGYISSSYYVRLVRDSRRK